MRKIGSVLPALMIPIFAASLNFTASVNRSEIGINEALILTLTVQGENIGNVPAPQIPDLPDFTTGGRSSSQSTNIQLINGKLTQQQSISFIYTLYPKTTGTKTIGACKLSFKGETYQTQPIEINVVKGSAPPAPAPRIDQTSKEEIKDELKLIATVDRTSVYVGEQINVEFSIYTRIDASYGNLEKPSFNGFWVEPIFDAQQIKYETAAHEGKQYSKFLLKKTALFPIQDGQLPITPMKITASVALRPTSFFDFGRTENVTLSSNLIRINVRPLPEDGQPGEFCGGVGKFTASAKLDQTTSNAAEPVNLRLRISGAGNVKMIQKPDMPTIPGVRILDPEVKEQTQFTGNQIQGYKEFLFPIVPQVDGEHVIPAIRIAYFDPANGRYVMLATERLKFVATQTAIASPIVASSTMKKIGSDINHIKPDRVRLSGRKFTADWIISGAYILAVLTVAAAFIYRRHADRLFTDRAYARKVRSSRITRKRIREAEQALKKDNLGEFYSALARGLEGYIGDRFNLDTGALTKEQIADFLEARGIRSDLITDLIRIIGHCEQSRFSRDTQGADPHRIMQQAEQLIREI